MWKGRKYFWQHNWNESKDDSIMFQVVYLPEKQNKPTVTEWIAMSQMVYLVAGAW